MQVKIYLPTPLRQYADGKDVVQVNANTVGEALKSLTDMFSPLRKQIFTETGSIRSFVNVFVNEDDIRHLQGQETRLKDGDTIYIIPSIAGGLESISHMKTMHRRLSRTLKSYGRITIPNRLLKQAKRREVSLMLEDMKYIFEPDKYGRIYIPPEIREKLGSMTSYEVVLMDGELLLRFRRF